MTQPFTTRAQSEAIGGLDPALIEKMAEAAYEALKPTRSSLPPWKQVEPAYQAERRQEMAAAVTWAIRNGKLEVRG